jgi:hypothetical protein
MKQSMVRFRYRSMARLAALVAFLLAVPVPVLAVEPGPLGTIPAPTAIAIGHSFSSAIGAFEDDFFFTILSPTVINAAASSLSLGPQLGIAGLHADIFTAGGALVADGYSTVLGPASVTAIDPVELAPGAYRLSLTGMVAGFAGGAYAGVINFVAALPVPEPHALALLTVGIALVIPLTRRARRSAG